MAEQIKFDQILQDEASFQLVRTNPKLTGNVKLTISQEDKMWLNSIDANEELSKSLYKRVAIDPTVSLPGNMYNFFTGGDTPSEIVFDLSEQFDSTKTSSDYKDQYDFSEYFSGVKYLPSRRYDERLSYFAPLFLKKDVPDYFIIFKINDPINDNISSIKDQYPFDREHYLKETFKKSTLIKTFNISKDTKVGKYLRDYVNDPSFPSNPLDVSYQEDVLTNWNGILYDSGVFGSRGEDLYEFYKESNPIKFFEEFMTLGFERNGVIFPNILNLEFIFNDDTSELYDFNRYFGVYVNAIELSKLDIDIDRAYGERGSWENTPRLRRQYFEWEDVTISQENQDGVIVPVKNSTVYFSDFEDIFKDKDNMFFNYISDRHGNLKMPKLDDPYDIDYDGTTELLSSRIRLSDSSLDMGDFFGPGQSFLQDKGQNTSNRGYSHAYIKINSSNHLDSIKIYHPHGSRTDSNGKYELIEGVSGYSLVPNPGDYYIYNDIDGVAGFNTYYYNSDGSNEEVASAISTCLNGIKNASFKSILIDDTLVIKANSAGDFDSIYKLEFISGSGNYGNVTINDLTSPDLIGAVIEFEGGSRPAGNRLILDVNHTQKIKDNIDNILVKTKEGWSKIKKISKYIDALSEVNLTTLSDQRAALKKFFENAAVALELEETPAIINSEFNMKLKHRPSFGLLSFFPIKDFDFDFYSSEYLNFPQIDLYQYYHTPPKLKTLRLFSFYNAYGIGVIRLENGREIKVNGETEVSTSPFLPDNAGLPDPFEYEVISGDVILDALPKGSPSSNNRFNPSFDENEELKSFEGFFLIKDPDRVIPESEDGIYTLRDRYLNGIANSEYDFYKENSSKDFALKSKVIPYITKWVAPDGLDARSNPYRLNTELVFGYNNFSPDHEDRSQNPSNFTHEWYYIESKFNYSEDPHIVNLNNSYFPEPFELDRALSESGYFIDYFTYTPSLNGEEIGKTQTRYTPIEKNRLGEYETFFKGFKIQFKDYIDPNNLNEAGKPEANPLTNRFEDYKFTCLLKTIKEDINDSSIPPIRYRFIEHKDFKFIILLIELRIGHLGQIDSSWGDDYSYSQSYDRISNKPTDSTKGDLNILDNTELPDIAYNTINGDYRIQFEDVSGLDISNMNHTLLYALKHKKFNYTLDNFSNIKLSNKFHLKNPSFSGNDTLFVLDNQAITGYPASLTDEFKVFNDKTYVIGYDTGLMEDHIIDSFTGITPDYNNTMTAISNQGITYEDAGPLNLLDAASNSQYQPIPALTLGSGYVQDFYTFKIMSGGFGYFETLFEKLSFGEFKEILNSQDPFMEYESYSYSGSVMNETASWYSEVPDSASISKVSAIIADVDDEVPSSYSFSDLIGFKYEKTALDNPYELNRYEGGFEPLFKDLFYFNSKFNFNKNNIEPLDLSNTKFNINIDDFMTLSNFSHIKVAKTKILDLESNEEFDPLYEAVDELAIGRSGYNLLTSNWDWGFHYEYITKSESNPVSGALRIEEDDSFIGKIINVRSDIELEQFAEDTVDDITKINLNNYELVYQPEAESITGNINVENALTSFLLSDGIAAKFNEFLEVSSEYIGNFESIEDYVKEYINLNILKLYEIIEIEFYTKSDKSLIRGVDLQNNNGIEFRFLTDKERAEQGYKLNRNLQINKIDRFNLKFQIPRSLNSGILVSPKIKIKFI